jgi:DNA polymerase I
MEKKRKLLVLLDGNALIHRAYHALPPLTTKRGEPVNAVYGFAMTLFSVLEKFRPDYIAASFDLPGPTFRDELYAEYKATRVAAPDDLYEQIPRVKALVAAFNIPIYEQSGFEADDCVGTLARQAEREGVETIIVTGDTDTLQLVTERVKVFTLRKGLKDMVLYGPTEVQEKYGFPPERLVDYKGLAGDASDNIPGVSGVGPKTATELIREHGSLEEIYTALASVKPKVREKLERDREQAFLSKRLGTIDTAVPLSLDLSATVVHEYDRERLTAMLRDLEFYSLLKRLPGVPEEEHVAPAKSPKQKRARRLETAAAVESFLSKAEGSIAVVLGSGGESLFDARIEAVGLATTETAIEVVWNAETEPALLAFFAAEEQAKVVYDWKAAWHRLAACRGVLSGVRTDILLSAYVADSGGKVDIGTLSEALLGAAWKEWSLAEQAAALLQMEARLAARLADIAATQTPGKTVQDILAQLELPLVPVLFRMEEAGILLRQEVFRDLSREIDTALGKAEGAVYALAGRTFNLNSPKQLADVLFVDLAIPTGNIKKNKTGFSTASTELDKLRAEYPIIRSIEEYRELFKLKTTYVDVLPALVDPDGRLHTTYQQAVTATGRLSSQDPNLQNIPIRTEWGNRIRTGFIAAPGKKLVGADYSQIELRIAAHLSGDENMIRAFEQGEDIHRATAALVHGIPADAVTDPLRREAKVLNFGIIYGMGAFGLAQAAGIDQKSASEFIKSYLKKFSGVARYMEAMRALAHERGVVETELGRRRSFPEIGSSNQGLVRAAERMAINMPIQGLAADIMKLAMLAADRLVRERYAGRATMLLQVHDELIFEVAEAAAHDFARDLVSAMESVYPLRVPLVVSAEIGTHWGEI